MPLNPRLKMMNRIHSGDYLFEDPIMDRAQFCQDWYSSVKLGRSKCARDPAECVGNLWSEQH